MQVAKPVDWPLEGQTVQVSVSGDKQKTLPGRLVSQWSVALDETESDKQCIGKVGDAFVFEDQGIARTQSPTNKNCAPESPTFGVIAKVSQTVVQWKGLTLEEPP